MDEETIIIPPEDVEIIDASEYREELTEHFGQVPEVAKPLLKGAKTAFSKIEKALYTAPAFINAVKAAVPDVTLQAVLTDEQKQQIAKGALKLMTKKDGSLMANLINPETKKIVTTIPFEIRTDGSRDDTGNDEFFYSNANGADCGGDTGGAACSRGSANGSRVRSIGNGI